VSYRIQRPLGADPPPPDAAEASIMPLDLRRGYVQVPTYDVRQYVQTTLVTLALGFGAGVTVGAIFGNILGTRKAENVGKLFRNRRRRRRSSRRPRRNAGKRRTSARKRKRGRPAGGPVNDQMTVKLPDGFVDVEVRRGDVLVDGRRMGSVYDLGTSFRAIPRRGEVRSYGTLAGAVKHVIRDAEAA
jgi:hypothetical protein